MRGDDFRAAGHELVDWVADYLEGVERHRVSPDVVPGEIRGQIGAHV